MRGAAGKDCRSRQNLPREKRLQMSSLGNSERAGRSRQAERAEGHCLQGRVAEDLQHRELTLR
jgi:hypothetical protein